MDWNTIIWAAIWVVAGLFVLGIIAWIIVASLATRAFKATTREFDKHSERMSRGFDRL